MTGVQAVRLQGMCERGNCMKSYSGKIVFPIVFMLCAAVIPGATVYGQSVEIVSTDFEKGTQKWERRGQAVSVRGTDKEAAGGKKSLHVKGRTEFWQGAQLNITRLLKRGVSYKFRVSVKLEKGYPPALIKMTLQKGDNAFYSLSSATVTDTEWTPLTGTYRSDGNEPFVLSFIESDDPRVAFYIDDFSIEGFDIDPDKKGTILKTDFQDGTPQNWLIHGEGLQVFSGQIGDNVVLKVDGRKESSDGLALDVTPYLFPGKTYRMSVSTFLGGGPPTDTMRIRVRRTTSDGDVSYKEVASADDVKETGWTKLSGEYEVPGDGSYLVIVEAKGSKTSFFIDDFELVVP